MATNSIYDLKKGFLSSQLRILNGPLDPPRGWQEQIPEGEDGDLPEVVVDQVLYKLNIVAKKHQKLVYSAQALRHVAEQIDDLYWKNNNNLEGTTRDDDALRRGVDLKDPQNIELLPNSYPAEGHESEADLEQYQTLKAKLFNLSDALQVQRQRHAYYSQLKALIEPFANPQDSVQPNLISRDGQLGKELERMRILASKLAFQIENARLTGPEEGRGGGGGGGEREGDMDEGMEERLHNILAAS